MDDAEYIRYWYGPVTVYSEAETREQFFPLRDRIFNKQEMGNAEMTDMFGDPSWVKVIIRGGIFDSNRTTWPDTLETRDDWLLYDPRDELQPLFDLLIEDGILEVVHLEPFFPHRNQRATVTRPTSASVRCLNRQVMPNLIPPSHLIFDRTARWGAYGSSDEFGLLGGEPLFMKRFIDRSGGMKLIRERTDRFWQDELDTNGPEAQGVPYFYKLAGWDNPPRKRGT